MKPVSLGIILTTLLCSCLFVNTVNALDSSEADKIPPPPKGYAQIVVYRYGHITLQWKPKVQIDGVDILRIKNKSYSWFNIEPGKYTLAFVLGTGDRRTNIEIVSGRTYFFRYLGNALVNMKDIAQIHIVEKIDFYRDLPYLKRYIAPKNQTITKEYIKNAKIILQKKEKEAWNNDGS